MSQLELNILAVDGTIHGRAHESDCDRVVAALSADPESIAELEMAITRYGRQDADRGFFVTFRPGVCHEPWHAGIVWIDLQARLVASQSIYSARSHHGEVLMDRGHTCGRDHDIAVEDRACRNVDNAQDADGDEDDGDDAVLVPYHLASDWKMLHDVHEFESLSGRRRTERSAASWPDLREVLYGRLSGFIVGEMRAQRSVLADLDATAQYELIREIHIRWLVNRQEGLAGRSPREVMIDHRHSHIVWDLQHQAQRWSFFKSSPPGVARESAAYRDSGFGTHEIVLYYDLVRELLRECLSYLTSAAPGSQDATVQLEHLQMHQQEWLHQPLADMHGRTPASMIDRERRRLPEAISGEEAIIDHDCPTCQMMADESFGPVFWHLDGCEMDEDFAFSFHITRAEWEEEQRQYEEWNRKFAEEQKSRQKIDGGTDDEDESLF